MASVRVCNLTKIYAANVKPVDSISFEVEDKGVLSLLGPSGCGKSTILRMIAGLETVSGGEIYIGDRLVNRVHPSGRDIAMVFQSYALYPHMTVFENVAVNLRLKKVRHEEITRRVHEVARLLDIEALLDRKPKALSGGQRQRVALGRAIIRKPQVFLLDEPLSNLDAILRERMRAELRALFNKLGATVIYVTHDQTEAMTMSSRIAVLNQGKIQQIGTPEVIYNEPANVFVANFVGSPRINVLRCSVEEKGLAINGQKLPLSGARWSQLDGRRSVLLGIRPENIQMGQGGSVRARVLLTEPLGAFTVYRLGLDGQVIDALVEPQVRLQGDVGVQFDETHLHFFDPETEQRIG
ncbi:MAG: ABC transporter ATP-binding protein [Bacillota bacterium]